MTAPTEEHIARLTAEVTDEELLAAKMAYLMPDGRLIDALTAFLRARQEAKE